MTIDKKCPCCGKKFKSIPDNARPGCEDLPGWYWECECGSTLYVSESKRKIWNGKSYNNLDTSEDGIADMALNTQTGEITGKAISIAWMISNGSIDGKEILPKLAPNLLRAVEENLRIGF